MNLTTGLTLLLVAAKLFGYGHYSWIVAFSPKLVVIASALGLTVLKAVIDVISLRQKRAAFRKQYENAFRTR